MHLAVGIEKDRIDREVAPRRIGRPIGVESDAGAAAVSLDIAPQRGDFEMARRGPGDCGHGAVREAGRHDLDAALLQQLDHPLRRCGSGDVDVSNRSPEQGVADRAADEPDLCAACGERGEHAQRRRLDHPRLWFDADRIVSIGHRPGLGSMCPGTMWSPSQRGGT